MTMSSQSQSQSTFMVLYRSEKLLEGDPDSQSPYRCNSNHFIEGDCVKTDLTALRHAVEREVGKMQT